MSGRNGTYKKDRDGKTVFRSPDEFENRYFPDSRAERKEREKLKKMTPERRAEYEGKKMADASMEEAKKEAGL